MFQPRLRNLNGTILLLLLFLLLGSPCVVSTAQETEAERAAAALLQATVTVRVLPVRGVQGTSGASLATQQNATPPANDGNQPRGEKQPSLPPPSKSPASLSGRADLNYDTQEIVDAYRAAEEPADVLVSSGVSLGGGRILTFNQLPIPKPDIIADPNAQADQPIASNTKTGTARQSRSASLGPEYRVTLPDGEQAVAEARVIDQYSGLVLLEIEQRDLPGLSLAEELPRIGGTVISASAAGIDRPLISQGILSGIDRSLPGANLPPMIQCDISTTEASSGAALLDQHQKLIGIIAATDATSQQFGWSFAIPFRHIRRVLEAHVEGRLVVLARQRAVVGLKLGPGPQEGTVVVEHVMPGGPADLAGIRAGEMVLETEGRKIRSAYQAVAIILKRMPGDEMTFVLGTEKSQRTVRVKLGGAAPVATPPASNEASPYQVGPQVKLRVVGPNKYEVFNRARVSELSVQGDNSGQAQQRAATSETELLVKQLQAYQDLILVLQNERLDRQNKEQEQAKIMQGLQKELVDLKRQLEEKRAENRKY